MPIKLGQSSPAGTTWEKFLERHNLPRQNQEEIGNMNRSATRNEIETEIYNFQQTKDQGQMASQVNSTKNLEK